MHRTDLIQGLISKKKKPTYLEIGVNNGSTFFRIKCAKKIAVDPVFVFSNVKKQLWKIVNPYNFGNHYFNQKSNEFFESNKPYLKALNGFDVIFVDGMHTFRNSLEDILHSLEYIKSDGTIVVHDCFPPNKIASLPTRSHPSEEEQNIEGWTGAWCGDVWKSIVYLKKKFSDHLDIKVINSDYGLGVITLKKNIVNPRKINEDLFEQVNQLTYDELIEDPGSFLNLMSEKDFSNT